MIYNIPQRPGKRPQTKGPMPHFQLDQLSTKTIENKFANTVFSLEGLTKKPTRMSLPGAKGIFIKSKSEAKIKFILSSDGEIGHIHPEPELGSMHLQIPEDLANELIKNEWCEFHLLLKQGVFPPNLVMVYAPQNDSDILFLRWVVIASYNYVRGLSITPWVTN